MSTIRAFIAVALPDTVKAALVDIAAVLGRALPHGAVRWVRPEAMHLTLRFLGDTDVQRLPDVSAALDTVANANAPLEMVLGAVGCFPNTRWPCVIWVGLTGDELRLLNLKRDLDAALEPLGWLVEDKPFRAHLTLGRVKEDANVRDFAADAAVPALSVPIQALHLIESDLRPDGPRYTTRHTARLRTG